MNRREPRFRCPGHLGRLALNISNSSAGASGGRRAHSFLFAASAAMLSIALAQPAFAQASAPSGPEAAPAQVGTTSPSGGEPLNSNVSAAGEAAQPLTSTSANPSGIGEPTVAHTVAADIVVTGSRIARRDYEANSPIVTANQQLLQQSASTSIEANLNKLPQFTPANGKTPTTGGGDIQPTATNTPGSASVSLRGLGANRTLVLINGRRATPADANNTVDINTIPSAAVERVEIISGGASSTYGADAVSGVTNFILKSKFSGLELNAQSGITQRGDGFEFQVSGIVGANFDDGRGNVSLAMSLTDRHSADQAGRSWYKDLYANPNIAGTGFFLPNPSVNIAAIPPTNPNPKSVFVSAATLATLFPGASVPGSNATYFVNPDGTLFTGNSLTTTGGAKFAKDVDGFTLKNLANGQIGANDTYNYVSFPSTRYNVFAQGNYQISEAVEAFFQANFSNTQTHTIQEPGPVANGWAAIIPYNSAAPQANIPVAMRTLLNGRMHLDGTSAANDPFTLYYLLPFLRTSDGDVYSYNMTAGLRGHLPINDWTYEIFGSQGRTLSTVTQKGFVSLSRIRTLLASTNFGQGFSQQGNAPFGGFGASTAKCTTGLNPFGGAISNDCLEAIKADIQTKSTVNQTIWEGDLQGSLFKLPAGDLKFAVGASYRDNGYSFQNDTLTTQGRSFQDQALGLYPSGNSAGDIKAREVYGELAVPVLKDIPFIQEFNLELGGRISHYNTTGTSYTYKALGDWKVNDWIRFRGGYNRAERAPNVAELFLAPQQTFAVAAGGDVCSTLNLLPYSANPAKNPTNAVKVQALCRVLMDRSGDPAAATTYYAGAQPQGSGFVFPTLQGNGGLKPEKADTYTAGVVLSSPFQENWLKRLRLTVDYYNIKVKDAIAPQSVDIAQRQCFDPALNPTFSADNTACLAIGRNAGNGGLGNVLTTYLNNGRFRTSGIDVQLDWSIPIGPGQVNLNSVFNYLLYTKASELSSIPVVDYAGTLGPTVDGLNGGSYRYRVFTTVGYSIGGNSLSLQWQHLPHVLTETSATIPTTTIGGYPSYDLFNLLGTVAATKDLVFRFGVENLFDKAPPLGGINSAPSAGNVAGGSFNAQFYDIVGRRFYMGAKAKF